MLTTRSKEPGSGRVLAHVLFEEHDLRLGTRASACRAPPARTAGVVEPGGAHVRIALDDPKEDLRLPAPEVEDVAPGSSSSASIISSTSSSARGFMNARPSWAIAVKSSLSNYPEPRRAAASSRRGT